MPVSSEYSKILVMLRHGDHFTTSSGAGRHPMKDPSPKSWQDSTNNVTQARLSANSPVRTAPQTSKDGSDPEHPKYSPIQPLRSMEEVHIVEAAQTGQR